ncbi:MAG TPA: ABC transporter permease subunit [Candidatus Bathyarchaeia archaeon]|nr:ABC transporter permease subunit [Candidatus Bathyarchaeia archaeon]
MARSSEKLPMHAAPDGMAAITIERLEAREQRAAAARARRDWLLHTTARLVVLAGVIGLWQALASRYDITLLPGPGPTVAALRRGWSLIAPAAVDTASEIALGFALGTLIGLLVGSLIGQSKRAEEILHPYLIAYQALPKVGLAPLIVLLLGFGLLPKVALAALSAAFPVLENTLLGVQRVDEDSARLFAGLGAGRLQTYFKLRVISALPAILTGVRVAVVLATVAVVVAEFVAGRIGLGAVMMVGYAQLDTPLVFAALFVLTAVGLAYYFAAVALEALVLRWFNLAPPAR